MAVSPNSVNFHKGDTKVFYFTEWKYKAGAQITVVATTYLFGVEIVIPCDAWMFVDIVPDPSEKGVRGTLTFKNNLTGYCADLYFGILWPSSALVQLQCTYRPDAGTQDPVKEYIDVHLVA